jgi:hypothetical protein
MLWFWNIALAISVFMVCFLVWKLPGRFDEWPKKWEVWLFFIAMIMVVVSVCGMIVAI